MKHIEMKVQEGSNRWEDTSIFARLDIHTTLTKAELVADSMGKLLANLYSCQTRWEFTGIGQGHYNYPDPRPRQQ